MTTLIRELPRPARTAVRALWGATLLSVALLGFHLATGIGEPIHQALSPFTYLLLAALCLARAALVRVTRLPWLLFGVGMVLWAGGYAYYYAVLARLEAPPYPSIADALWLGYFVCALAALIVLMRSHRLVRSSVWLDALLGVLALAALAAVVLVDPVLESTGGRVAAVATGLSYPLLDVLNIGVILFVFALSGWRVGRRWAVLAFASCAFLVFDVIYLYQSATGTYTGETLLDLGWTIALLAIAGAAWMTPEPRRVSAPSGLAPAVVPTIFAVMGIGLTTYGLFTERHDVASALTVATLVVGFARASMAFADVRSLSRSKSLLERQALILDSAGEGILSLDTSGRMTLANAAALRLTGFTEDELIGRDHHDTVQPTRADGTPYPFAESPVFASLRDGTVEEVSGEVFWRKDGGSFPVEYTVTPIVEHREVTGAVLVFRDVTERREVERMKDEFTSVVSHELRTPLTAIRGSLGLLAGGMLGPLGEKAQQMAEIAVDNTDRLVRLINDMLDIERIESGGVAMEKERCDAADLVARAAETMESLAEEAGVHLEVAAEPAPLWADPDRILQTLGNLLSNAIKFSGPGATVRVETARAGDEVIVRVRDEGRGIPSDKLEAVFERFEQVDASDSREKGGTGLGLAICASIVGQHGGRIWVESEPGEGSTFSFALPAGPEIAKWSAVPRPANKPHAEPPLVLVCDDDPSILEVVATLVESRGFRVARAASGREAIELAGRERPAAILLDLLMPGMDGWDTASVLRRQAGTGELPVVILSALHQGDTDPVAADVVAWLEKPMHERSLLDALDRAVTRRDLPSRVLIVEDDQDLARVLEATFQAHGIETYHAATGPTAIEMAQNVQPDLLVLDLSLPGCDGFAVVAWLRRHHSLSATAVLVYTARDLDHEDRERLRLGGPSAFLTKGRVGAGAVEKRVLDLLSCITHHEHSGAAPHEHQAHPARR